MPTSDHERFNFKQRMAKGIVQELHIGELRLMTASSLTTDEIDNYPVLVITPARPPDYPKEAMEEFYIIPLTDRSVPSREGPVLHPLKANSIMQAAEDLFNTIYGRGHIPNVSTNGLTPTTE